MNLGGNILSNVVVNFVSKQCLSRAEIIILTATITTTYIEGIKEVVKLKGTGPMPLLLSTIV